MLIEGFLYLLKHLNNEKKELVSTDIYNLFNSTKLYFVQSYCKLGRRGERMDNLFKTGTLDNLVLPMVYQLAKR